MKSEYFSAVQVLDHSSVHPIKKALFYMYWTLSLLVPVSINLGVHAYLWLKMRILRKERKKKGNNILSKGSSAIDLKKENRIIVMCLLNVAIQIIYFMVYALASKLKLSMIALGITRGINCLCGGLIALLMLKQIKDELRKVVGIVRKMITNVKPKSSNATVSYNDDILSPSASGWI